jgi:hypothetical protein
MKMTTWVWRKYLNPVYFRNFETFTSHPRWPLAPSTIKIAATTARKLETTTAHIFSLRI